MKFTRERGVFPRSETYRMPPVKELLGCWIKPGDVVVDPFARDSLVGIYRNDLDPATSAAYHMDAREFCRQLLEDGVEADVVLFDPPYSPRQIKELYEAIGLECLQSDTQNGVLYAKTRRLLADLLKVGGVAISFGWNSAGWGPGFELEEILLLNHGGAHNDTICCVNRKRQRDLFQRTTG